MHPGPVELVDILVVPEDRLDRPAFLVRLIDDLARAVVVGFEDDGAELLPAQSVVLGVVSVPVLLEVRVLLGRRLGGVPEGVQPLPLVPDPRLLAYDLRIAVQGRLEFVHPVAVDERRIPLQRQEVVETGVVGERLVGGFDAESLVGYDESLADGVGVYEVPERDDIQHVPRIDLGAYRLLRLHVVRVQDRYVLGAFGTCLPGIVGQGVHGALVGFQGAVYHKMVGSLQFGDTVPHEPHDLGVGLPYVLVELADGVLGQRHARIEFGKERVFIGVLQLVVLDPVIAYPQDGDAVQLQGVVPVVYAAQPVQEVGGAILHEPDVRPALMSTGLSDTRALSSIGTYFPSTMCPTIGPSTGTLRPSTILQDGRDLRIWLQASL